MILKFIIFTIALLFSQYSSCYAQTNACTDAANAACNPFTCVQVGSNPFCLCNDGSLQPTAASCGVDPITTTQSPVVIPNACTNAVCPAGSTCVPTCQNPPRYICLCPNNIIGNPNCPTTPLANNPCQPNTPCRNGGTCVVHPLTLQAVCICPSGFYGPNCSYGCSRTCDPNWCYNGGRCTSAYGSPYCLCGDGYRGRRCELRFNAQNYVYFHRHPHPRW